MSAVHTALQLAAQLAVAEKWDAQKFQDEAFAYFDVAAGVRPCVRQPVLWLKPCEVTEPGRYEHMWIDDKTIGSRGVIVIQQTADMELRLNAHLMSELDERIRLRKMPR